MCLIKNCIKNKQTKKLQDFLCYAPGVLLNHENEIPKQLI